MQSDPLILLIDEELARLRQIRTILLPLLTLKSLPKARVPRADPSSVAASSDTKLEPAPPVEIKQLPAREPRVRRVRIPNAVEQPTALKGAIPTAPVVFRAGTSKRIEPAVLTPPQQAAPGSFAALIRAAEKELLPAS